MRFKILAATVALGLSTVAANACEAPVNGLGASIPSGGAWDVVGNALSDCGFSIGGNPVVYGVDNESVLPLLKTRAVRPLNELVKAYPGDIHSSRLIKDEWRIVAIVNSVEGRQLMYRKDIFDKLSLEPPKSYGEILRVLYQIRRAGVLDTPWAEAYQTGGDMGATFVDIYLGMAGNLFLDGYDASIYNPRGVAALEMMQMLSGYAQPDFLQTDLDEVQRRLANGEIALAMLPSDRAAALTNSALSPMAANIAIAPAPISGHRPAAAVHWRGLSISAAATEQEATDAFAAMMAGVDADMANGNALAANWHIDGHTPGATAQSMIDGAPTYPSGPQMSLLQQAIADGVAPFLIGGEDPSAVLLDIELVYKNAAKASGLLN
ncbi:MAG: ABC transporter substrate-binding protein [Pikeienuella sp.]